MSKQGKAPTQISEHRKRTEGITVKLAELFASTNALGFLMGQALPAATSFRLAKTVKCANAEMTQYQETRKALCERLSNKDAEGKPLMRKDKNEQSGEEQEVFDIPANKMAEFEKEHNELLQTEVTLPGKPFVISDFARLEIAPAYLMNLEWLISG